MLVKLNLQHVPHFQTPKFDTAVMSTFCPGCSGYFSRDGYTHHIRQSANILCHQIYNNQLAFIPESDPPIPSSDPVLGFDRLESNSLTQHSFLFHGGSLEESTPNIHPVNPGDTGDLEEHPM